MCDYLLSMVNEVLFYDVTIMCYRQNNSWDCQEKRNQEIFEIMGYQISGTGIRELL